MPFKKNDPRTIEISRQAGKMPKRRRHYVTQHIISELNAKGSKGALRIHDLAVALVDLACTGDVTACREIMDRIEGKAVQVSENHNVNYNVGELSDDELYGIIRGGSGDGDFEAEDDPKKLN